MRKHTKFIVFVCTICLLLTLSACTIPVENRQNTTPTFIAPPGWDQYHTETIELWLPQIFHQRDTAEIPLNEALVESNTEILFYAIEDSSNSDAFLSTIVAGRQIMQDELSFSQYRWFYQDSLPENTHGIQYDEITDASYPMARIILKIERPNADPAIQTLYLISVGNYIYSISFTTLSDNYQAEKELYEQIISTVQIAHHGESGFLGENDQGVACLAGLALVFLAILLEAWLKRKKKKDTIPPLILPKGF